MPATIEQIGEFLRSPDWTPEEKAVIEWQFRLCGHFKTALWEAIIRADDNNLEALEKGFPVEVGGYRMWAWGDLGRRLREAGLSI